MCTLDIILAICLSAALIQGIIKGFTEQVIALVAIIAGTWTAYKFTGLVCGMLQPYLNMSDRILHVIVFILMIVAVILVLHLLGKVIKASIDFVMLGWLDKLLGGSSTNPRNTHYTFQYIELSFQHRTGIRHRRLRPIRNSQENRLHGFPLLQGTAVQTIR